MSEEKDLEARILSEARAQLMNASPEKIRYKFFGRDIQEYYSITFNGYRFQVTQRRRRGVDSVYYWYTLDIYKGSMEVASERLDSMDWPIFYDMTKRYARRAQASHAKRLLAAIEKSRTGGN